MRTNRALALLSPLVLCLSTACEHNDQTMPIPGISTPRPADTTSMTTSRPQPASPRTDADPAEALLWATDQMQLPDVQRIAVRGLEEQLQASRKQTMIAFEAMRHDVAQQVRAGTIDPAQAQTDESMAVTALQTHVAKEADILNGLHGELDASQRTSAVAAVRAKQSGRTEAQGGAGGAPSTTTGEDVARGRVDRLTRDLGLDAAQVQQLESVMGGQSATRMMDAEERERRLETILSGFESGTFDARSLLPPATQIADMVRQRTDREVALLTKLVPILRPDQREKLAASIESRGVRDQDD